MTGIHMLLILTREETNITSSGTGGLRAHFEPPGAQGTAKDTNQNENHYRKHF